MLRTYTYPCEVERVIDGITFELSLDLGFGLRSQQQFRLYDVDVAEHDEAAIDNWLLGAGDLWATTVKDRGQYLVVIYDQFGEKLNNVLRERSWEN